MARLFTSKTAGKIFSIGSEFDFGNGVGRMAFSGVFNWHRRSTRNAVFCIYDLGVVSNCVNDMGI